MQYTRKKEDKPPVQASHALVSWTLPPAGKAKINVDGAVAKTMNNESFKAVCRGDINTFLGASSITIEEFTDPEVLEAMACAEAMSLTIELQLSNILVSSHSLRVIKEIGRIEARDSLHDYQGGVDHEG
jgi:ribonuclease HI